MSTCGISMMRDEEDICYWTVKHMMTQVDEVIVINNASVDSTGDILNELGVTVLDDPDTSYYQSRKMTYLAHKAAELGVSWVVPFDADEVWYYPFGRIGDYLDSLASQWLTVEAALYNHITTGLDGREENPLQRIGWRWREPGALPKVACRLREDLIILQGNHGASYNGGPTVAPERFVIRHYPYRSAEQFCRKAKNGAEAYARTDLDPEIGKHWRQYGEILKNEGEEALGDVFRKWFHVENPATMSNVLIYDPAPVEL